MKASERDEAMDFAGLLQGALEESQLALGDPESRDSIHELLKDVQTRAYYFYTNELHSYFSLLWENIVAANPEFEQAITEQMGARSEAVCGDLLSDQLAIRERQALVPFDFGDSSRRNKLTVLRQQSDQIKSKISEIDASLEGPGEEQEARDMREVYQKLYSEDKLKEAEEFVRRKREEQLEREKKLREQRQKEEAELQQKEEEIRRQEAELQQKRKEAVLQKQQEQHARREREKSAREQRDSDYRRVRKSLNELTPLHKQLEDRFERRYREEERERVQNMHSDRKHYVEHLDHQVWEAHEKSYEELRERKEAQRRERRAKMGAEERTRLKAHSSYELPAKEQDPKEAEREQAKEKRDKMRQYRAIVREKYQPRVDPDKRKELLNLIEEMEIGNRRVKKTRLPNGSVVYEEMRAGDAKMMGMEYLEQVKEMAAKARLQRKSGDEFGGGKSKEEPERKRPIDYLEQLRQNRPKASKTEFVERKNLSYEDKVKQVMLQSDRLAQATKQSEMMLKFGKFKTSEEILACKECIDQNYLDIVNMKLKLIMNQAGNLDANGQEDDSESN